jgi:uncharacterized protein DUF5681
MSAVAIVPNQLKPAVPPLISHCFGRCFRRCYATVLSLFSGSDHKEKMHMDQGVVEIRAGSPNVMEQRPLADPHGGAVEPVRPPGRPWVKGQSGNPRGRPSRARQAAIVAEALIGRKTVPLTNTLINLALSGDRAALRLCLDRIAPARRELPVDLDLPVVVKRADLSAALTTIAEAAASGSLTTSQCETLTRMLVAQWRATW